MANKTITALNLIAAVTDDVNMPVDNGIQTYRATMAQVVDYLAGNTNRRRFTNHTYRSVVSTDAVAATDDVMALSGASFTSTLPTAVGKSGKRYKFIHKGTSLSQVYTLATTSGQTIDGIASGAYALYTNGEMIEVESDNANWTIIDRYASTDWIDFPSVAAGTLIKASSSDPTFGTIAHNYAGWKRNGSGVNLRWNFRQSSTGAAGSGTYLFKLISGLDPASAKLGAVSDTGYLGGAMVGQFNVYNTGSGGNDTYVGGVFIRDTTTLYCSGILANTALGLSAGPWGSGATFFHFGNGALSCNLNVVDMPVTGWRS